MSFSCTYCTKPPYKGPFTPKSLRSSAATVDRPYTNVFLKPQATLHINKIVGKLTPPLDFFVDGMYVRDPLIALCG